MNIKQMEYTKGKKKTKFMTIMIYLEVEDFHIYKKIFQLEIDMQLS